MPRQLTRGTFSSLIWKQVTELLRVDQKRPLTLFFTLLGKVDIITGVGKPLESHLVEWGAPNRPVSSSGIFGSFLITPASEAVFVINGDTRTVNCEIGGLIHPRHVLWMPSRP